MIDAGGTRERWRRFLRRYAWSASVGSRPLPRQDRLVPGRLRFEGIARPGSPDRLDRKSRRYQQPPEIGVRVDVLADGPAKDARLAAARIDDRPIGAGLPAVRVIARGVGDLDVGHWLVDIGYRLLQAPRHAGAVERIDDERAARPQHAVDRTQHPGVVAP